LYKKYPINFNTILAVPGSFRQDRQAGGLPVPFSSLPLRLAWIMLK